MRKWIPAPLIVLSLFASAWAYGRLPERVAPRWDAVMPWLPPTAAAQPRALAAFLIPAMAALTWLLLRGLASQGGERFGKAVFPRWLVSERTGTQAVARFGPTFDAIVAGVVAFFLLFHHVVLGTALGWPDWTVNGFGVLTGIGLLLLGNVMPRTRPNWIAGVRTPSTLRDPDLWRQTHRYFGALLMLSGIAVIMAALVAPRYALVTGMVGLILSGLGALLLARLGGGPDAGKAPTATLLALGCLGTGSAGLGAQVPAPTPPDGVVEQPFDVPSGSLTLAGTLALPAEARGTIPVAVIVAGSGPTDRNGNGPLVKTDLYAQLAFGLAQHGIASLRYDKRGIEATMLKVDHSSLTMDDYVSDVIAAARLVAADERFSKVFLIGHSEGAGLVLMAANRGAPAAGVVMMSGVGRPFQAVLHDQFAQVTDSATLAQCDTAVARFIRGEEITDAPAVARSVLSPVYRRFIASAAAYDPEAEIAKAAVPVLIVQGGLDLQVREVDADRLRAARPTAAWLSIPEANHVFKAATTMDRMAQRLLYQDRTIAIVPELVPGIVNWMASAR